MVSVSKVWYWITTINLPDVPNDRQFNKQQWKYNPCETRSSISYSWNRQLSKKVCIKQENKYIVFSKAQATAFTDTDNAVVLTPHKFLDQSRHPQKFVGIIIIIIWWNNSPSILTIPACTVRVACLLSGMLLLVKFRWIGQGSVFACSLCQFLPV